MLWWQTLQHMGKILVLAFLLLSERVVGAPFASWIWFYRWYGSDILSEKWYLALFWAIVCSVSYRIPLGLMMLVVLAWVILIKFGDQKKFTLKWWLPLVTGLVTLLAIWYLQLSWTLGLIWLFGNTAIWIWLQEKSKKTYGY